MDKHEIIVHCDCSALDHISRFTYYTDEKQLDEFLYVQSGMDIEIPFWYRLKNAFNYLFKRKEAAWVFNDAVLLPSEGRNLLQFLQQYNDYVERNDLFR